MLGFYSFHLRMCPSPGWSHVVVCCVCMLCICCMVFLFTSMFVCLFSAYYSSTTAYSPHHHDTETDSSGAPLLLWSLTQNHVYWKWCSQLGGQCFVFCLFVFSPLLLLTGAPFDPGWLCFSFYWYDYCLLLERCVGSWTFLSLQMQLDDQLEWKPYYYFFNSCILCTVFRSYTPCSLSSAARGQRLMVVHNRPHSCLCDCLCKLLCVQPTGLLSPTI